MKNTLYITLFLLGCLSQAQTALYNHDQGNIQIHENGQIGFHTNLINEGTLDQNLGLVGFYSDDTIDVQGNTPPTFYDVEFATQVSTILRTSVNLTNSANFISGNVFTPREDSSVSLNFIGDDALSAGEADTNKVNGYAGISQKRSFLFPVGNEGALRPLLINSENNNDFAQCAYFYENPNSPSTFGQSFDTSQKAADLASISTTEFWRLEGGVSSTIQISWDQASDIASITNDASSIVIVGWGKATNQWVNLGGGQPVGDLEGGFAASISFIPDDYEIITFGTAGQPIDPEDMGLENYLVTPNGDGINDTLVIEELQQSPNNTVRIFDRFGLKVFEKDNYINEFDGFATDGSFVTDMNSGLPSGVYFYIANLHDLDLEFQGFLYLSARP